MNDQTFVWFTRKPLITVISLLLLTLCLGWFVQYFKIDASAETLLVKDNKLYIQSQVMNERFSPDEFILLAYEPKLHDVFSDKTFKDLQALSKKLTTLPRVSSVIHILNVPLLSQMSSLDPNLKPDEWTWQNKQFSYKKMRQIFDKHPIFTDLLVNKNMSATSIQIIFKKNKALTDIESQIIQLDKKRLTNDFTDEDEEKVAQLKYKADPIRQELNKKTRKRN